MTAAHLGSKHVLLPVSPYRRALGTTHWDLEQLLCRATSHRALKMPAHSSHPLCSFHSQCHQNTLRCQVQRQVPGVEP